MKRESSQPILSAVFVDYDNIYLSLRRKSEEAARRFAKDASTWLRGLESGVLMTANPGFTAQTPRRVVLARCYGNPVPRRNAHDNATDMNSFPFVRHHFLRAGFEIVDCPPLTQQMKNSSDIRMVMDMRDYLTHETYFDEFIILSGDADFTPVLHRLRQHARRTVVFANDHTAIPYTAISDGEVREADLIELLLRDQQGQTSADVSPATLVAVAPVSAPISRPYPEAGPEQQSPAPQHASPQPLAASGPGHTAGLVYQQPAPVAPQAPLSDPHQQEIRKPAPDLTIVRDEIIAEVATAVRSASAPLPLEALAERATRVLGHERTIGTRWAGLGFMELLRQHLPTDVHLSTEAPFYAYDGRRQLAAAQPTLGPIAQPTVTQPGNGRDAVPQPITGAPGAHAQQATPMPSPSPVMARPQTAATEPAHAPQGRGQPMTQPQARPAAASEPDSPRTRLIAKIAQASAVPTLSSRAYRVLFESMVEELIANGLQGEKTFASISHRLDAEHVTLKRDDIKLVFDIVSKPDPWFEKGVDVEIFANRFRNHMIAACRDRGVILSATDLDVIDDLVLGRLSDEIEPHQPSSGAYSPMRSMMPQRPSATPSAPAQPVQQPAAKPASRTAPATHDQQSNRWWSLNDTSRQPTQPAQPASDEAMPRFVRARG